MQTICGIDGFDLFTPEDVKSNYGVDALTLTTHCADELVKSQGEFIVISIF